MSGSNNSAGENVEKPPENPFLTIDPSITPLFLGAASCQLPDPTLHFEGVKLVQVA